MPAVARQLEIDYDAYDSETDNSEQVAVVPRHRWQGESAPVEKKEQSTPKGSTPKARPTASPTSRYSRSTPGTHEMQALLSHFGGVDAEREAELREQIKARRRARRRHRPFRLNAVAIVLVGAPLCLVASLLWMRSSALALSRHDAKLQDRIAAARFDLERTRKEIAALNASPHLESWAKKRGWRRATQTDFDQVPARVINAKTATDP